MKFFVLIFSSYLMAISLLPCADAFNEYNKTTLTAMQLQDDDHSTDHTDACSPFCICSCCSSLVNVKNTLLFAKSSHLNITALQKFPLKDISFVSDHHGNIWQPPKIS